MDIILLPALFYNSILLRNTFFLKIENWQKSSAFRHNAFKKIAFSTPCTPCNISRFYNFASDFALNFKLGLSRSISTNSPKRLDTKNTTLFFRIHCSTFRLEASTTLYTIRKSKGYNGEIFLEFNRFKLPATHVLETSPFQRTCQHPNLSFFTRLISSSATLYHSKITALPNLV